jgi:hypothetical protein
MVFRTTVFSGFQSLYGPFAMQTVGQRVVNRINAGLIQQVLIAVEYPADAVRYSKCVRTLTAPGGYSGQFNAVNLPDRYGQGSGCYPCCPEDPDFQNSIIFHWFRLDQLARDNLQYWG